LLELRLPLQLGLHVVPGRLRLHQGDVTVGASAHPGDILGTIGLDLRRL